MPVTAILYGAILIVIGIVGYVYGVMNDKASITALIPAAFGIVLAALGLASQAKEGLRKHLMHAALVVALLGFIATAGRLLSRVSELSASPAVISQALMAIVCLAFVVLGIRSFAAARRNREA
jgi:glucose uptake protein GlcU